MDIRAMNHEELTALNRNGKELREQIDALRGMTIPEPPQDGAEPSTVGVGRQLELL